MKQEAPKLSGKNQSQYIISELHDIGVSDPDSNLLKMSKKRMDFFRNLINHVSGWVGSDESVESKAWLNRNKKSIPKEIRKGGTLFRGFSFETEKQIKEIIAGTFRTSETSSWSRNVDTAENFARLSRHRWGVVVGLRIPDSDVIIDVDAFIKSDRIKRIAQAVNAVKEYEFTSIAHDVAEDEGEVLVNLKSKLLTKHNIHTVYKDRKPNFDLF